MATLRDDEKAAIEAATEECTVCGHLVLFHDNGDGGYGSCCYACPRKADGGFNTKIHGDNGTYNRTQLRDPVARAKLKREQARAARIARRGQLAYNKKLHKELLERQKERNAHFQKLVDERAKRLIAHPELAATLTGDDQFNMLASGLTEAQVARFQKQMLEAGRARS